MPRASTLFAWLVAACLLLRARPAAAEINAADSLEWMTADAELVVRGRVTAVTSRPGPGSVVWYVATIGVTEVVKGKAPRRVTVAIRELGRDDPRVWMAKRQDRLWFLVAGARRADEDRDYRRAPFALRPGDGASLLLAAAGGDRAYTASFAVLDRADDLLAVARAAASSTATRAHHVDVPYDAPAFQALYAGSSVWLWVPVDASLERLALAWLASPDVSTREQGALALAHFPSAASARAVEALLNDPGFATVTESGKAPVRRYLVRARAHDVLTAWKVAHRTPVIDEPTAP